MTATGSFNETRELMGKKWQKIDPAEIKVGDRVRKVTLIGDGITNIAEGVVTSVTPAWIVFGSVRLYRNEGTWYIRKPKKQKPLTRPDEPPVGSFFRVDRTGREFYRYPQVSLTHYFHLACGAGDRPWVAWADVTEPGDTIQLLKLVAVDE